ncbi:hypothetical protein [Methyloprofundus sp.]|uniref:hypothetical protein n=1 Tax=Methyloprofundus sp. TaxID=2020875 RepID=UPI003D1530D0
MKKALTILFTLWCVFSATTIQAQNPTNNTQTIQFIDNENFSVTQKFTATQDTNSDSPIGKSGLLILAIICFFLAKKHQQLAKKHQNLTKKHRNMINSDSIFHH